MGIIMSRRWVKMAVAVAAAGLAASACGTLQMGAAATTNNSRISSATLTAQVANLNTAYQADTAKGFKPQRPASQAAQQVLTWLILFKVYDQIASKQGIYVTQQQAQQQLNSLSSQAASSKATLAEYVSAAGAVPPDLVPQLGRYFAILSRLEGRLDGGKAPTTSAEQSALEAKVGKEQCYASRDLGITVNPQYGVWDYRTYSVVAAQPTLATKPGPTVSPSPVVTKAPC
jgi:SurA N-terminal domain